MSEFIPEEAYTKNCWLCECLGTYDFQETNFHGQPLRNVTQVREDQPGSQGKYIQSGIRNELHIPKFENVASGNNPYKSLIWLIDKM